jgi:CRP-like cAMP-binding protein/1-acyl-sn-glycerol-3-phosphate acyltransferase
VSTPTESATEVATEVLRQAPFAADLPRAELAELARHATLVEYAAGERMFAQGEPASRLMLLVDGAVELDVGTEGPDAGLAPLQSIRHTGHPVGWSALVEPYAYRATATALEPTRLVALDRDRLEALAAASPAFGAALMRAVLGVVGDRLRALRLRVVARRYDDEVAAIRELLAESGHLLPVSSPLHKIPHYLEHRTTLADAFACLDAMAERADPEERALAELVGDLLDRVRQELAVYQALQAIYDEVARATPDATPEQVRTRCALGFRRLFDLTRWRVQGTELLPREPGHVFILNHLTNHPDNLLPNDFVLTLDTHFVSSMLLYERYREAPIRVIRKSRPDEYGHQMFYERLGYVHTYAGYVDAEPGQRDVPAEVRRRFFLDAAGLYLALGKNVVICPEGACTSTEASPLRLRPGAFELAARARPERLVVPVAVANFDKQLTRTTVAAVVHEPFRVSDHVADPTDRAALLRFLNDDLWPRYHRWVREAATLADTERR